MKRHGVDALLGVTAALTLLSVWGFEWFPTQDGPSHLYNAHVLLHLDEAPFAAVYESQWSLVPNLLGTAFLVLFGSFLPLAVAEKLLISVALVGFVAGFRMLVRGDRDFTPAVALLGPLLCFNYPLHMGFYSFALGLALVPWGWWAASTDRLWAAGAIAVVAWFAHLAACLLVMAGVVVFAWRRAWVLAPATALMVWYLVGFESSDPVRLALGDLLERIVTLRAASAYNGVQEYVAMGAAAAMAVLAGTFGRSGDRRWLVLVAACLVLYLVLPDGSAGHWFLSERLSLAPWLALAPLAAGPVEPGRNQRTVLVGLCCALSLGSVAATVPHAERLNGELKSYHALQDRVAGGETLLPLDFNVDAERFERARPFLHAAGWYGINRMAIDAGNYEAHTSHFQTRLQKFVVMPDQNTLMSAPEAVDFARFRSRIRYVLTRNLPAAARLSLEAHYVEIASDGVHALFERRPLRDAK